MARASLASAATVAALLTACGPDVAPAVPPEELTGTAWSLTDASGSTPVAGIPVTLRFDDDGSVHGSGGCNRLAGRFAVDGARLTIEDKLATTRRSCPEAVMTLEHSLVDRLERATDFSISGAGLTIRSGQDLTVFEAQSGDITDIAWRVLRHHDGGSAAISVIEGTQAEITFASDGTISGTGGCNRLLGSYHSDADEIRIEPLASTQKACPTPAGVMEQEAQIIAALEGARTFSIDGDRLELRASDGQLAVAFIQAQ